MPPINAAPRRRTKLRFLRLLWKKETVKCQLSIGHPSIGQSVPPWRAFPARSAGHGCSATRARR